MLAMLSMATDPSAVDVKRYKPTDHNSHSHSHSGAGDAATICSDVSGVSDNVHKHDRDRSEKLVDGNALESNASVGKRQRTKRVRHRKPTKDTIYKCAVCGDVAFGYNFNAITCESCKAFFRRNSSSNSNPYECPNTRTCRISKSTRKYCPACRFDKCLNVGMKREAIDIDGPAVSVSSGDESCSSVSEKACDASKSLKRVHPDFPKVQTHSPPTIRKEEASLPFKKRALCDLDIPTMGSKSEPQTLPVAVLPRVQPQVVVSGAVPNTLGRLATVSGVIGNVDEFNGVYLTCQRYAGAMMQPFKDSQDTTRIGSTVTTTGLGELLAKQFVRFVKGLTDFASLDSTRQFSVLQANFVSCHVVNYGYMLGSQRDSSSLPLELSKLHEAVRVRFARTGAVDWPVLLAALGMMALFSPHRFVSSAEGDRERSSTNSQLLELLYPLHYRYVRFLQQYLGAMGRSEAQPEREDSSDWLFCLEIVEQVRSVGELISRTSALGSQLTAVIADLLYSV